MVVDPELLDVAWYPYLEPAAEDPRPDGRYEDVHFDERVVESVAASGARFFECALSSVTFEGGNLHRSRFRDSWIEGGRWLGTNASVSDWMDVEVRETVFAGVQAFDTQLRRVTFRRVRLDSVNLRAAQLQEVLFIDCQLAHVDLAGATLDNVTFSGCDIEALILDHAKLHDVDLSEAASLSIATGHDALGGASITTAQLVDLSPGLAHALGIVVKDLPA